MTTYEQLMRDALAATRRDALDESEALLRQALAIAPGAPMPHYLRATNLAHSGLYELAEASYMACLTRAPDFAIARFQLGLLQVTGGRPVIAHASWEPLLALADDHPLKLFVRGLLALLGEQWAQARTLILGGIDRNHDNEPLNDDMRGVLARMDHAEAEAALAGAEVGGAADGHFLIGAYRRQ